MTSNDVYERLGVLEQLVQHLYAKTGVPMPDIQTLARSQVLVYGQHLLASGDKMGATHRGLSSRSDGFEDQDSVVWGPRL
jgi:hypothetical protein